MRSRCNYAETSWLFLAMKLIQNLPALYFSSKNQRSRLCAYKPSSGVSRYPCHNNASMIWKTSRNLRGEPSQYMNEWQVSTVVKYLLSYRKLSASGPTTFHSPPTISRSAQSPDQSAEALSANPPWRERLRGTRGRRGGPSRGRSYCLTR
jgi:hypothetical protein